MGFTGLRGMLCMRKMLALNASGSVISLMSTTA
jgi:hypothetical protein